MPMQLYAMLKKMYIQALPLTVLVAPVLPMHLNLHTLRQSAYSVYLIFFISFFLLGYFIRHTFQARDASPNKKRLYAFLWYLCLLFNAGILIWSLHTLRAYPVPTVFYGTLIAATLYGLQQKFDTKQIFWGSCVLSVLYFSVVCMTGFEALGFHAYPATGLYSIAIACVLTGQQIIIDITSHQPDLDESVKNPRTRKQRRKRRAQVEAFSDTRGTRLTAGILLLLGPVILTLMGMTPLFERRFIMISLTMLLYREPLSILLPTAQAIELPDNFIERYTGLCYIFLAMIGLLRLVPFL